MKSISKSLGLLVLIGTAHYVACGPQPDQDQLGLLVADLVTPNEVLQSSSTVVLDEHYLQNLPASTVPAIQKRLTDASVSWVEIDLHGDIEALPGEWDVMEGVGGLGRMNRTHRLLKVALAGRGQEVTLEWGFQCGPLCGWGERFDLRWNGEEWEHSRVERIRY